MTKGRLDRRAEPSGALLALALLALIIRVAVPPGFMADPTGGAGLVLCTSHGFPDPGGKTPPASANPDVPCAFAGHAAAPAPETFRLAVSAAFEAIPAVQAARPDQTPGRGLAAPPPHAIGPPVLI